MPLLARRFVLAGAAVMAFAARAAELGLPPPAQEHLVASLMVQVPGQGFHERSVFQGLVYQAISQ